MGIPPISMTHHITLMAVWHTGLGGIISHTSSYPAEHVLP